MRELGKVSDYRLVGVAGGVWLGAAVAGGRPELTGFVAAVLGLVAFSVIVFCSDPPLWTLIAVSGAFVIGLTVGAVGVAQFRADPLVASVDGGQIRMQVRLLDQPRPRPSPWGRDPGIAWAEATAVELRPGSWVKSRAEVLLIGPDLLFAQRGDNLEVQGTLDSGFAARAPRAGALQLSAISLVDGPPRWQRGANRLQERLQAATAGHPATVRGLISGMAVGDDRLIPADARESMRLASLTHLTAVSASHMVVILGAIALLLPGWRQLRPAAAGIFIVGLIAVVGPEPAVLRSAFVTALVLWGMVKKRVTQPVASLCVAVTLLILWDSWLATNVGFSLSVLATWGLLTTARQWAILGRRWLEARPGRSRREGRTDGQRLKKAVEAALAALSVSLVASIWVLPVTVLLNPWFPTYGPIANVLAAPAVPPLTIMGLLAALVSGWSPGLAAFLCDLAAPFARWVAGVAQVTSSLPGATIPMPAGTAGVAVALMLLGLILAGTWRLQRLSWPNPRTCGGFRRPVKEIP